MYGKRKSGVFFAVRVGLHAAFWKFHSAGTYVTSSQHSNVQVTITEACLNFAVTESRILLPVVSSCRRVKPSRKIALNSNGEVYYKELARRPWINRKTLFITDKQCFLIGKHSFSLEKQSLLQKTMFFEWKAEFLKNHSFSNRNLSIEKHCFSRLETWKTQFFEMKNNVYRKTLFFDWKT